MTNERFPLKDMDLDDVVGGRNYVCRLGKNEKGQDVVIGVAEITKKVDGRDKKYKFETKWLVSNFEAMKKQFAGTHTFVDAQGKPFSVK